MIFGDLLKFTILI